MEATPSQMGDTSGVDATPALPRDSTDRPIPVWPEGVLAVVAAATLLVIGLRHRTWLQRKGREVQAAVQEFQKQGGLEDLTQVAQHAADLLKGGKG